ncbi:MAG TPA: hypothetical protein VLV87_05075 [Gammaproteobacteria bacterium]|nr:hypothetical protein [Gammaproteobacteria bacterium]
MRRAALLLASSLPVAALAADLTAAQLFASGKVMDHASVIVATAGPHDADMCRGFSLTESQVKYFFRRAAVMAPAELHRLYQDSPCEVEGHLRYQDQTFLFVVNAAYTGEIQIGPDKYLYFGCADCKDMFDYGYLTPAASSVPAPAAATHPQ